MIMVRLAPQMGTDGDTGCGITGLGDAALMARVRDQDSIQELVEFKTDRERRRQRDRRTERDRDGGKRQEDREAEREGERQRQRERDGWTERHRDRGKETGQRGRDRRCGVGRSLL